MTQHDNGRIDSANMNSCMVQVTGNLQAVQSGLAAICNQLRINPGKAWSEPISVSQLIGAAS